MPDYFHSALRGDQIHEAKIKVLPAESPFPVPEWEGQLLVVGLKLYVSVLQNAVLNWIHTQGSSILSLPANVVIFERGYGIPALRNETLSGVIYTNIDTDENYYLYNGRWLKLGGGGSVSNPNQLLIENNSFGDLIVPTDGTTNAALLKTWEAGKTYYFKFEAPPSTDLSSQAVPGYFVQIMYYDYLNPISLQGDVVVLNTTNLQDENAVYKLMVYFNNIYGTSVHCNFRFDLESRLIKVEAIAQIYYY